MQTEKRDFIIHAAMRGRSMDGSLNGNEQCSIMAVRTIEGFQTEKPNVFQQSYADRTIAWNYQMDVANYIQPLVYAATRYGNAIRNKEYFIEKYPCQVTDFGSKELR